MGEKKEKEHFSFLQIIGAYKWEHYKKNSLRMSVNSIIIDGNYNPMNREVKSPKVDESVSSTLRTTLVCDNEYVLLTTYTDNGHVAITYNFISDEISVETDLNKEITGYLLERITSEKLIQPKKFPLFVENLIRNNIDKCNDEEIQMAILQSILESNFIDRKSKSRSRSKKTN